MYYALVFYPQFDSKLEEEINEFRWKYDPTAGWIKPHGTIVFPVPDSIGEGKLVSHVKQVIADLEPFEIYLGGFHRSNDHWLFLTLTKGKNQVKSLNRVLYTGILEEYQREDIEFVPQIGLGLFLKPGVLYDWNNPKETDFDQQKFEEALQQAKALSLDSSCVLEKLHFVGMPDEVIEWATGKRANIPKSSRSTDLLEFRLGGGNI